MDMRCSFLHCLKHLIVESMLRASELRCCVQFCRQTSPSYIFRRVNIVGSQLVCPPVKTEFYMSLLGITNVSESKHNDINATVSGQRFQKGFKRAAEMICSNRFLASRRDFVSTCCSFIYLGGLSRQPC
eukprot:5393262-Amphidinium_carterae.1